MKNLTRTFAVLAIAGSVLAMGVTGSTHPRLQRAGAVPPPGQDAVAASVATAAYLEATYQAVQHYLESLWLQEHYLTALYVAAHPQPVIPVDWALWQRLHQCEQGNTWYANGGNPADPAHQTFQGGLGMSTGAWQMAVSAAASRGVTLPSSALSATPEQQMTGAQAFYDRWGWGWACHV